VAGTGQTGSVLQHRRLVMAGSTSTTPVLAPDTVATLPPCSTTPVLVLHAVEALARYVSPALVLDTVEALASFVTKLIDDGKAVAVDFEGVDICRHGELCIVQLAQLDGETVLVDICALGERAFTDGRLKELFESESVMKIGYDGRADCDQLNALGVRMRCFYDIQVLYCTLRDSRSVRGRDPYVKGLGHALDELLAPAEAARLKLVKEVGLQLFAPEKGGSYEVWRTRPLHPVLITYGAADVEFLHRMRLEWGHAAPEADVLRIGAMRIERAIGGLEPPKGREQAKKDW
jgi:exonuclease 3'-5' domain-containing protein 1